MQTPRQPKEGSNEPRKWSRSDIQILWQVLAVPRLLPLCLVHRGDLEFCEISAVTMMEKGPGNWQHTDQGSGRGRPILNRLETEH